MSWIKKAEQDNIPGESVERLIGAAVEAHKWAMTQSESQQVIPWLEELESALKALGVAPWEDGYDAGDAAEARREDYEREFSHIINDTEAIK